MPPEAPRELEAERTLGPVSMSIFTNACLLLPVLVVVAGQIPGYLSYSAAQVARTQETRDATEGAFSNGVSSFVKLSLRPLAPTQPPSSSRSFLSFDRRGGLLEKKPSARLEAASWHQASGKVLFICPVNKALSKHALPKKKARNNERDNLPP